MPPVQVRGQVLSNRPMGAYHLISVVAPGIAENFRPGQFVAIAVGGEDGSMLLRRCFSVYGAKPRGVYGGTVDFVYAVHGKGTQWLSRQRQHDPIDVVGPMGRPFALPRQPCNVTLVGGGYGTRAAVLPRRGAAGQGLPGRLRDGRRDREQAVRLPRRQADVRQHRGHDRRRQHGGAGPGLRHPARGPRAHRSPTWSMPVARWRCSGRSPRWPRSTACPASARSRSRWPAASASA